MIKIFIITLSTIVSYSLSVFSATPAIAQDKSEDNGFTVGTITLSPPEKYIITEDVKTGKRILYKEAAYDSADKKGLKLIDSVILEEIEYRYLLVSGDVKMASEQFELVEVKGRKAVLKKEHVDKPELVEEEEPLPVFPEEVLYIEEAADGLAPDKKTKARRLVASLFLKIKSSEISENEYEITLPTILDAAANFGEVLNVVVIKIDDLLDSESPTRIYLKSSLGSVRLGPGGLFVKSLNSAMRKKTGIKDDDLIKSINGKSITGIRDIVSVFSSYAGSAQTFTVSLTRDEEDLTITYYVR